jgi:hypothetical protein
MRFMQIVVALFAIHIAEFVASGLAIPGATTDEVSYKMQKHFSDSFFRI